MHDTWTKNSRKKYSVLSRISWENKLRRKFLKIKVFFSDKSYGCGPVLATVDAYIVSKSSTNFRLTLNSKRAFCRKNTFGNCITSIVTKVIHARGELNNIDTNKYNATSVISYNSPLLPKCLTGRNPNHTGVLTWNYPETFWAFHRHGHESIQQIITVPKFQFWQFCGKVEGWLFKVVIKYERTIVDSG